MKMSTFVSIALAMSTLLYHDGIGQTIENPKISDFEWLAGNWVGDGFGGISHESWTSPAADSMVGAYKHFKDGKVTFYEIMLISRTEVGISLRLKHFNPDLTGWEEKEKFVEFPFERATPTKIEFKGLSYELVAEGRMEIRLKLNRGGEVSTEIFQFEKKVGI